MQLAGNRKFEVTLTDERIDLSKARRVEPRSNLPHLPLGTPRGSATTAAQATPGSGSVSGQAPAAR
jgi:hypothetical protein